MAYARNRKRIMMSESVCGICGRPVDMSLKAPDPMSPTVDHIIPINKGGHPSDINNLQLAHWICNRMKSDKVIEPSKLAGNAKKSVRVSCDWKRF
jgi:5-methylcytosine-specific restriction endonuclease McrA